MPSETAAAEEMTDGSGDQAQTTPASGETESESRETEKESSEAAEKEKQKRAALIVKNEQGETIALQKITGPDQLTSGGSTCPVDYMQGISRIQVPEETATLQITVPDQKDQERISLTRWNGYLVKQDKTWLLCPDDPMEGAYTSEGNTYTVNLEQYELEPENVSLEQLAVYGSLNADFSYAEIFVYSEERSEVLLVEFVSEEVLTEESEAETTEKKNEGNISAESVTEDTDGDPAGIETETEAMLLLEMEEGCLDGVMTLAASAPEMKQSYSDAGKNLADSAAAYTPTVASMNGEWQILGLARSGQQVEEGLYDKYIENVVNTVKEKEGVLHKKKYTEYSRVVLALTALGEDVTDVGGYNLLEPLADFDQTVWQGVNGAIFALIAFDSHDYEIPTVADGKNQTTRAKLVNHILSQEVSGGGWDLSGRSADPDVTAMAIQALAPYYNTNSAVRNAVDRGVAKLSALQKKDGSYGSYGTVNSESCSQVIVALTALGIDPNTDSRFTKNGKSVVDALLTFQQSDGSFAHVSSGGSDQMATEQAYYALTSYQRFQNGQTSLYDMSDVALQSDYRKAEEAEKLITSLPGTITLQEKEQVQAALLAYNKLTALQKSLVSPADYEKLQAAFRTLEALDVEMESEQQTGTEAETEAITEKNPDDGSDDKNNAGITQKPSGSNKKPSGTTKKVNLVSGSNRTGSTSAGASALKGSSTGESEAETKAESETENRPGKKNGGTQISEAAKDVITDMGSLFSTAKTGQQLPEHAADYSDVQIESILEIYRSYETLTEQEKDIVEQNARYEKYLAVLDKVRAENHYDEATDTDLRDNGEEVLPWYVQMQVSPMLVEEDSASAVREALKGQGELLSLSDISLIDLMEGGEWQPEDLVRVRLLQTDTDSYENLAVVHMKDDGGMEFIEAHISGSYLEFDTDHFSRFGIVGYNGSMEELMEDRSEEQIWIYLIPGAGAAAVLVLLILFRVIDKRRRKRKYKA